MRFVQSLQRLRAYLKSGRSAPQSRRSRRRLECENLETRLAPACWASLSSPQLTVTCDGGADTVTLDATSTHMQLAATGMLPASYPLASVSQVQINLGNGANTVNVERTVASKPVTINGGNNNDIIRISPTAKNLNTIAGLVILGSGFGDDLLHINDQSYAGNSTYTLSIAHFGRPSTAGIQFNGFETTINGGSGNTTFAVTDTPTGFPIRLNTGTGVNTVNVYQTHGRLDINGQNGQDTINVGTGQVRVSGLLSVTNTNGSTALTIDDSAAVAPKSATLDEFHLTGLSPSGMVAWVPNDIRSLVIKGGSGGNTFTVSDTPKGIYNVTTMLHSGTGADTVKILETTGALTVHGQGGLDTVNVGLLGSVQQVAGAVHLTNSNSTTALTVNDGGDPAPRTATLSDTSLTGLAPASITWVENDLRSLTINGGSGGNTFKVSDTPNGVPNATTALYSGTGVDQVFVARTTGVLTINGQDSDDFVRIGALSAIAGSVQQINGAVTVQNTGGYTYLTIEDTLTLAPRTATLGKFNATTGQLIGLAPAPIQWVENDLKQLFIYGGSGGNTFTVNDTPTYSQFSYTAFRPGSGTNTVFVRATTGYLALEGGGNTTVHVGSTSNTLDGIQGLLQIATFTGTSHVTLHDEGSAVGHSYELSGNFVIRDSAVYINYGPSADVLTLSAGSGDDTFFVTGMDVNAGTAVTLNGGGGSNSVFGPNTNATWTLTGADTGSISSSVLEKPVSFTGMANLFGGTASDTFAFGANGTLSGWILGGGVHNKLDFSARPFNVYANLLTYTVNDSFAHLAYVYDIQDVTGSAAHDIVVGDDQSNILDGGLGHDLIIGGGSWYGLHPDTLLGGGGDDLLIAGFTLYDWDAQALANIRGEWTNGGDYAARVANLQNGSGLAPALNATTVFSNYAVGGNVVTGGAGLDLFFGNASADVSDCDAGLGEMFVPIY